MKRERKRPRLSSPAYEIITLLRLHGFKAKLFTFPGEIPENITFPDGSDPLIANQLKSTKHLNDDNLTNGEDFKNFFAK